MCVGDGQFKTAGKATIITTITFYSKQKCTVFEPLHTDLYREVKILHNLNTSFTKITILKRVTKL